MTHLKTLLCLGLAGGAALAAFAADEPADVKGLQGTWLPQKAELGGKPMPEAVLKTITLKIAGLDYEVTVTGEPRADKGTVTLEPGALPKEMKIVGVDGPNMGKTIPAIYELQGDTLRVCYDLSGAKRPAEFKTEAGSLLYLVTYQRKKG